jgi:hypothetical protein
MADTFFRVRRRGLKCTLPAEIADILVSLNVLRSTETEGIASASWQLISARTILLFALVWLD